MIARTRCEWAKFRECSDLVYGRFPLKLKGLLIKSCIRPAILCESEVWYLKESEMGILLVGQRDPLREQCVEYSSNT